MKNTFYYPEPIDLKECEKIIKKTEADLSETSFSKEEAKEYVEKMIANARPLSKQNPDCLYFGFDNPEHMPSACRVYYFYTPTYIAAAMMMKIAVKYPDLPESIPGYKETLKAVLSGCVGRRFEGGPYEERKGILDALEIFLKGDAGIFFKR